MKNNLVSVIIPTRYRLRLLKNAISSVLSQTILPFQIIIIDDENSKNSKHTLNKIKKKSKKIKIFNTKKNRGVAFANYNGKCF